MSHSRKTPPLPWLLTGIAAAAAHLDSLGGDYVFDDRTVPLDACEESRQAILEALSS